MSDHHRSSSYYKDSYGSSSSKRYHSPSEGSRMNMSGGGGDYYDTDNRSKRSRTDNYGPHTTTTRYSDYSASSSSASGSRYKTASSSSYYDLPGYKPSSSSSSSSKYLDDYKGSGSSSRSAPKSNMRRIPPPLTPPSLSSKSSSLRLQPLMKVSLPSNSSGVGSSSSKDYYGSRMRQAPPEHHYSSYSGSHSTSSSSYKQADFKRPLSYNSNSKSGPSSSYHSTARHGAGAPYRSNMNAASKRLLVRSRAPPHGGLASRNRGRVTMMNSRREPPARSRKMMSSARHATYNKRSRSRSDDKGNKTTGKDKNDEIDDEKKTEKKQPEDDSMDYVNMTDGQVVVEEVAGDDDDDEQEENHREGSNSVDHSEKGEERVKDDQPGKSNDEDNKNILKKEAEGSTEKGSEEQGKSQTRALLKLHCPYCDVRCISFREFTFHLRSNPHIRTMHGAVSDMKKKLIKVRQEMKEDQRKREKAEKVLSDTSSYCRVCELSFRTDPKEHEANEIHNKIKTMIYRRCDVCDIDFRIWKVHIYHMAALEHAKRVAMKELQEGDAKGDNVKGTNLSPEELGLDLVEIRTVFFCNACARYIPIKGEQEEAKRNHCMTLNHLKSVEEFNERERRRAQREEARERAKRKKIEEDEKQQEKNKDANSTEDADKTNAEGNAGSEGTAIGNIGTDEKVQQNIKQETVDTDEKVEDNVDGQKKTAETDTKESGETIATTGEETNRNEAEEDDDDEIELHAGEDDVEDESEDTGDWSRRTRSSQRGDGSTN